MLHMRHPRHCFHHNTTVFEMVSKQLKKTGLIRGTVPLQRCWCIYVYLLYNYTHTKIIDIQGSKSGLPSVNY